ncbi:MAG: LCP family protein [Dehalococcoidia bacterium]
MSWERPPFERPDRRFRQEPETPNPVAHRRRFNPLLIFAIALFAVGAFYVLLIVATIADDIFLPGNELQIGIKLPGVDGDNPEVADINERINIVVLGLDRRIGGSEDTAARTDTVFVLTIDPFSKTAGVFNIPRDLLVDIPDGYGGYYTDRVNTVWEVGEYSYQDYPGGGPGLVKDTIDHNFDIPIDNYVIIDFADFVDLVDEVGGVEIDVPEYVYDYGYSDTLGGAVYPVEFLPGPEHMDGERALAYARIRKGSNDFKRIERQQQVIQATAEKALSLDLLDPTKAVSLYNTYKDVVQTDIPDSKIPGLALLAKQIDLEAMEMVSIAEATFPCGECYASVLNADWDKIEELKAQVFADGKIQAEGALVELQNGSEQLGLAEEVAGFLRKHGIAADDLLLGDAATIQSGSVIVDLGGKEYTAKKLAEWLNLPSDSVVGATDPMASDYAGSTGDIIVVLGSDASLATAAVP